MLVVHMAVLLRPAQLRRILREVVFVRNPAVQEQGLYARSARCVWSVPGIKPVVGQAPVHCTNPKVFPQVYAALNIKQLFCTLRQFAAAVLCVLLWLLAKILQTQSVPLANQIGRQPLERHNTRDHSGQGSAFADRAKQDLPPDR